MDEDDFLAQFFGGRSSNMTGDDFFDHFDEFTDFLEKDTKFLRTMFRDIGKESRVKGKRRKAGGGMKGMKMDDMGMAFGMSMAMSGDMDMEDMMAFMMMGGMGMGGMGGGRGKKN